MRIRIVCYEEVNSWILGKFARKLHEALLHLGVEATIAKGPDPSADINHHIIYLDYIENNATPLDTLMITHLDSREKLAQVKKQLRVARAGICMSQETMNLLVSYGIDPAKVCYVLPAHDGAIHIKKICVGITSKVHRDGRKRQYLLLKLTDTISPAYFRFKVMGIGWQPVVQQLQRKGFEVEYYDAFDYETYRQMIPTLDYYLYMGLDEGSMGFIDALAAGVKTIVTPQGYHLEAAHGITHAFTTAEELIRIFSAIEQEKKLLVDSVRHWTWEAYARKHLDCWRYLLHGKITACTTKDGLHSLINKQTIPTGIWNKVVVHHKMLLLTGSRFLHAKDKVEKIRRKLHV